MDQELSREEKAHHDLEVRKGYRKLCEELKNLKNVENIEDRIKKNDEEANKLFKSVDKPREAIYDKDLLLTKLNIYQQQTQELQAGLIEFRSEDFSAKLATYVQERECNSNIFEVLGKKSYGVINTPPSFSPLYNCIDKQQPLEKRKERQCVKEKDKIGELKKPTLVDSSTAADKEASEIAERIFSILDSECNKNGGKPICYFSFVTNPDSFSETVENMFYVSILAREGVVKISSDTDGFPVIESIVPKEAEAVKRESVYSQAIISMDKADFENVVKSFKINKSMITRKRNKK